MTGRHELRTWPLVGVGSLSLASALALGGLLGPGEGPTRFDSRAWEAARWPPLWRALDLVLADRAWAVVQALFAVGTPGVAVALAVGLAVTHWWRGEPRVAAACLLGPIAAVALAALLLKPLFDRTYRGLAVYPSTHATATMASGAILVVLAWRSGGIRRALPTAGLWLLVSGVVVLHLLDRQLHYATDVIGGAGVGVGVTLLLCAALLTRPHRPGTEAA